MEQSPSGISVGNVDVFTTNNSNGISIQKVESYVRNCFVVSITKPVLGFSLHHLRLVIQYLLRGYNLRQGLQDQDSILQIMDSNSFQFLLMMKVAHLININ